MILKTYDIKKIDHLITPQDTAAITLNSPALDIFTDFQKTEPLVIESSIDVVAAEELMKKTHVKLKLVIDGQAFLGTLDYADLVGEKMMKLSHHTPRSQILVSEVMTPRGQLKGIAFDDLKRARIHDVVETLKNEGKQHFLVINEMDIRGILSASDIARRLHVPIDISRASSFIDIYKALNNDKY